MPNDDLIAALEWAVGQAQGCQADEVFVLGQLLTDLRAGNLVRREDVAPMTQALALAELTDAKKEIALLRDIVVTYGDKVRMATAHRMDWQQAIDRAFDRD